MLVQGLSNRRYQDERQDERLRSGAPDRYTAGVTQAQTPYRFWLAVVMAVADTAVIAAYFVDMDSTLFQAAMLVVKLGLVPIALRPQSVAVQQTPRLGMLAVLILASLVFAPVVLPSMLFQAVGFQAHLVLTLLLTSEEFVAYLRWVAYLIGGWFLLYIVMALTGQIVVHDNRLMFFSGTHPNLGAEIAAVGAVAAALSLPLIRYGGVAGICLVSTLLLQGRAGALVIVATIVLKALRISYRIGQHRERRGLLVLIVPVVLVASVASVPFIIQALRLDDKLRGLGTGFGGRTEHWSTAWGVFLDHPFTGQGLGSFRALEQLAPHDFFAYGLAEMGMLSVFLLLLLVNMGVAAYARHGWTILYALVLVVLMALNDRFMNLNPYPFLLFVILFVLSATPARSTVAHGRPMPRIRATWSRSPVS